MLLALLLSCSDQAAQPLPPLAEPAVVAPEAPEPPEPPEPLVAPQAPGPPTVVLISLDTTRADALGAWGAEDDPLPRTPVLDALAARGSRFAWALSSAVTTLPSHASVFSGRDLHGHGVYGNGQQLPADLPLLAEQLSAAGYDSLAAVGAYVMSGATGINRGFRSYDEPTDAAVARRAAEVTDAALALADQRHTEQPLLLFAHYYDAHTPWLQHQPERLAHFVDPAYAGDIDGTKASLKRLAQDSRRGRLEPADARQGRALYRAQVAAVDTEVGRLLDGLTQRGLMERAVVVVFGDHGEALDEGGLSSPWSHGPDVDLVVSHVPLLLAGSGLPPDRIPAGRVVDRPVGLVDLAPTLLALLELPSVPGAQGQDLGPLLRGQAGSSPPLFIRASQPKGAVRTPQGMRPVVEQGVVHQDHLLVRGATRQGLADQLFTLAQGQPAAQDEALTDALGALLDAWSAQAETPASVPPAVQERLKQLGYVDGGTAPSP